MFAAFPQRPRHSGNGSPHVARQLEFEQVFRALLSLLLVPRHDGFLAKANVPAIEPEPFADRRVPPEFFHRGLPVRRADGVAGPPFQMQAQPRARRHADERMMALASALVRVVSHDSIFLMAVAGVDRGIPVGHEALGQGGVEFGLGLLHPVAHLLDAHFPGESRQGVFAAHAFQVHDPNLRS